MKFQNQNPAYHRFKELLPESGRYPAKHVDIFWNTDDDLKVKDVEVVFIPRGQLDGEEAREFWEEYAAFNDRWMSDLGNSLADWLTEDGYTVEDIFGHLLAYGFATKDELESALEEFGHIEECGWARQMLKGFRDQ